MIDNSKVKQTKRQNRQKEGNEIIGIEIMTKVKEIYENILTKKRGSGRIMKLSRKGGRIQPCEVDKKK